MDETTECSSDAPPHPWKRVVTEAFTKGALLGAFVGIVAASWLDNSPEANLPESFACTITMGSLAVAAVGGSVLHLAVWLRARMLKDCVRVRRRSGTILAGVIYGLSTLTAAIIAGRFKTPANPQFVSLISAWITALALPVVFALILVRPKPRSE